MSWIRCRFKATTWSSSASSSRTAYTAATPKATRTRVPRRHQTGGCKLAAVISNGFGRRPGCHVGRSRLTLLLGRRARRQSRQVRKTRGSSSNATKWDIPVARRAGTCVERSGLSRYFGPQSPSQDCHKDLPDRAAGVHGQTELRRIEDIHFSAFACARFVGRAMPRPIRRGGSAQLRIDSLRAGDDADDAAQQGSRSEIDRPASAPGR